MDISSLTPEELQRLTPEQVQEELKRLTPEQLKRLTPEQTGAVMEILDPRFRPTPDEQERREAARTLRDAATWQRIASSCVEPILRSYELGELTFEEALDIVGRIAIGCWPQARVELLGTAAALALRIPNHQKRKPGVTKPLYPACIKSGAADLILSFKESQPEKRRTPTAYDPNSPLIQEALQILTIMR